MPTFPGSTGVKDVKFQVVGRKGSFHVEPGELPLIATMVIEGPVGSHNQCGESIFPGPPPAPSCAITSFGRILRCQ